MAKIVVVGAGIGGATTAALLAKRGHQVIVFDQAIVPGGCASTFQRRGYIFDVGATQVAGLEPGGIHHRIFSELEIDLPPATECDPACAVFLPGETTPISVWRDPQRWQTEREQQFPGSETFWSLLQKLFEISWQFQSRDPVLPPRNFWDIGQLLAAVRPDTLLTLPFTLATVGDALNWLGLRNNRRLRLFLDLQLKLYSQVTASETALLYAATALGVSQAPQGLYHLNGSMQTLVDRLIASLERDGGKLFMRHQVTEIQTDSKGATGVAVTNNKTGESWVESADYVVANVPIQNLAEMVTSASISSQNSIAYGATCGHVWSEVASDPCVAGRGAIDRPSAAKSWGWQNYRRGTAKLPTPSAAFVIYLGVDRSAIPPDCPPHLQFLYDEQGVIGENNSLFVSVSKEGDGRAPAGKATIIASSFTDPNKWDAPDADVAAMKAEYIKGAIDRLSTFFQLSPEYIEVCEAGTPQTFEKFTGRYRGYVGGVGQRVATFGPFGVANRTPIDGLWLVGDSTHPGEGTAGVSYSALTVVRQIDQCDR
jgi:phytoene dehydrogenase-like protein